MISSRPICATHIDYLVPIDQRDHHGSPIDILIIFYKVSCVCRLSCLHYKSFWHVFASIWDIFDASNTGNHSAHRPPSPILIYQPSPKKSVSPPIPRSTAWITFLTHSLHIDNIFEPLNGPPRSPHPSPHPHFLSESRNFHIRPKHVIPGPINRF
jgi:hypothetical protein